MYLYNNTYLLKVTNLNQLTNLWKWRKRFVDENFYDDALVTDATGQQSLNLCMKVSLSINYEYTLLFLIKKIALGECPHWELSVKASSSEQ